MLNILLIFLSLPFGAEKKRVKIQIENHKQVYEITGMGISIEGLKGSYAETHLSEEDIKRLEDAGFKVEILPDETYPKVASGYHNYDAMVSKLDSIVSGHPQIAKKFSIGTSQQGRKIWVLKISDNVNTDEDEPEVRFIGIIHGDEPVGCEMVLNLADTLTSMYGQDPYLTSLVDNREIFIIPMFNPDGRENASRYFADGTDPNRNFPVPDGTAGDDGTYDLCIETDSLIQWSDTMNIVMSITYHGGARIVNYQWDYDNALPPYYSLIRKISIGYAIRNDSIFLAPDPSNADSGTVRGYTWYEVNGSLQDWAYHETGCIDLTIELNPTKWPDSTKLPELWRENREAMLWFVEQAGYGVWGHVRDVNTGNPIACTYYVLPESTKVFRNDSIVGDFHRPLLTGTYTFVFNANGYSTRTISGVNVKYDSTTYLDVEMYPLVSVNVSGSVTDTLGSPIDSARVEIIGQGATYTDAGGNYSITVDAGELYFAVSKTGYATTYDTASVQSDTTIDFVLRGLNQYDFPSADTIPIPDNDPVGIVDSVFVPGHLSVDDIETFVDISHTYISDLVVKLVSPSGTNVTLHNRSGGSNNNIYGWYDSELPVDGPGSLDDYYGEDAYGWWKLIVSDNASYDTGQLNHWILRIYTPDSYTGLIGENRRGLIVFERAISPTRVFLSLPSTGFYSIRIFDVSGRLIKDLSNFYGRERQDLSIGDIHSNGVYFIKVFGKGVNLVRKFVVVK